MGARPEGPSAVTELTSARLILRRADMCPPDPVADFFAANVDHLDPWLPEAVAIATDPSVGPALIARSESERAAGREERWFLYVTDRPAEVVGYVFLTRFRADGHRSCELSGGLGAAHTGQGLMTEACERILQHAEQTLGFSRVDARYAVDNPTSGRLLDRLGFTRIGVAPEHARIGGVWRDHVLATRVRRPS